MEQNKMATKPMFPLLMSMAFPPMLSMFIQSLYNIVDSMFVAKYSQDALTAVSLAFPIQNLIIAAAVGTGVGINSFIARKLGEKQFHEANNAVTHGILLSVFHSLLFVIFGFLFIPSFFRAFTNSPSIFKLGCNYTYIIVFFCFSCQIHVAIEKILQATGQMIFPMIFQAIGAIINIILDPIMIFGLFGFPKLGIEGAAIATIIGQFSAMALSIFVLLFQKHDVKPVIKGFQFHKDIIKQIYVVGFPSILMNSIGSILVMGLNGILITFSEIAVSIFGIYFKLQSFIFMPIGGLIQGAMPIMGYNYGAKNHDRLLSALKDSLKVSLFIMTFGTILFCTFPKQCLLLFDATPEMLSIGTLTLRIISVSYIPAAITFIFATLFQAIGKGFYSLIIFLLRQLVITLPVAFILSKPLGLNGVWLSFPIAETISVFVSLILFFIVYKKEPIFQKKKLSLETTLDN